MPLFRIILLILSASSVVHAAAHRPDGGSWSEPPASAAAPLVPTAPLAPPPASPQTEVSEDDAKRGAKRHRDEASSSSSETHKRGRPSGEGDEKEEKSASGASVPAPVRMQDLSLEELVKRAGTGNARAQHELGYMYAMGLGVAQSDTTAVEWWTKAAAQGHASAQFNLGVLYARGRGVVLDLKRALYWYMGGNLPQGNLWISDLGIPVTDPLPRDEGGRETEYAEARATLERLCHSFSRHIQGEYDEKTGWSQGLGKATERLGTLTVTGMTTDLTSASPYAREFAALEAPSLKNLVNRGSAGMIALRALTRSPYATIPVHGDRARARVFLKVDLSPEVSMYALDAPELVEPLRDARAFFKGITDRITYLEDEIKDFGDMVKEKRAQRKLLLRELSMLKNAKGSPTSLSLDEHEPAVQVVTKLEEQLESEQTILETLETALPKTIEPLQKEIDYWKSIPTAFQRLMSDSSASKATLFAQRFPRYRGLVAPAPVVVPAPVAAAAPVMLIAPPPAV